MKNADPIEKRYNKAQNTVFNPPTAIMTVQVPIVLSDK